MLRGGENKQQTYFHISFRITKFVDELNEIIEMECEYKVETFMDL